MVCEDNQEEEKKRGDDLKGDREVSDTPPEPPATISAEEPEESSRRPESLTKTSTSPDPLHQVQRHQPGGPQVSRWDKTIIEKIRSYYEAAAKAEEGEEVEEQLREGAWWRRRSSFSEIPSGLVKDSVSQFDVGEHQWEERTKAQSSPPEETNPPTSSLDLLLDPGPSADVTQDQKSPNRGGSVGEEVELLRRHEKVCSQPGDGPQEETSGRGQEASSNQNQRREGTSPRNPARANEAPAAESLSSSKEQFREPAERSGSRTDSSCTRTGRRDLAAAPQSSAGIEAGSCSQNPRTVSANRAFFEATASHVAGISLFEAGPVVDPVLMENSARILSRVQTLALMYSTKASSMKLPLHQKQADKPSLSSTRPAPTHQNRVQSQNPREEQLHSEKTKEPDSRCGNQTKIQHQHQSQNQTGSRTHGQARVDGTGTHSHDQVDRTRTHGQDRADGTGTNSQDWADETGTHGQDRVDGARNHGQARADGR